MPFAAIFETEIIMKRFVHFYSQNRCGPTLRACNDCCTELIVRPEDNVTPCCCTPKDNINNECVNIIASITMVEAGLAHILNAEGEKIQKLLEISNCPCELLALNKSVNSVVEQATQLEQILCQKLGFAVALIERSQNNCHSLHSQNS
jgi:hypothetical protein